MMLADSERQRRFVDALRTANDTAIDHLDRHAAVARRCGEIVSTHGLVGATYFHGTSRALDPHPHHHNVIANAVVDDHGGIRALDARALYLHAPTAAALATAAARWELRDLGLGWWQRADGMWEIAGVGDAVIDEFSSRHRDIREVRDALEAQLGRPVSDNERRRIWSDTRGDKTAVDPAELLAEWRQRAERVGFDVDVCFDRPDAAIAFDRLDDTLTARLHGDLLDPQHGLCSHADRFDRGDVVRAIADWSIGDEHGQRRKVLLPPVEVERLADEFLTQRQVIALSAALSRGVIRRRDGTVVDGGRPVRTYTTAEVVWTQHQIISSWRGGRGGGHGIVAPGADRQRPRRRRRRRAERRATPPRHRVVHERRPGARRRRDGPGPARPRRCAPRREHGRAPATGSSAPPSKAKRPASSATTPASTPTPSPCCSPGCAATSQCSTPAPC